jgi:hypothetical protein
MAFNLGFNPFNRQDNSRQAQPAGNTQQNQQQNQHPANGGGNFQQSQNGPSGSVPNTQQNNQQNNQQQNNQQQNNQQTDGRDQAPDITKLWQNGTSDDPNSNTQTRNTSYVPAFKPEQLQELAKQHKFTKNALTPERRQAIVGGGEGAVDAMIDMLDESLQQAFLTTFQANSRLTDAALRNAENGFFEKVPNHVRSAITANNISSKNPIVKNPNHAPLVEVVRLQAEQAYPRATPDQITQLVETYFNDLISSGQQQQNQQQQQQNPINNSSKLREGAPDADWDEWADASIASNIFGTPPTGNTAQPNQQQPNNSQQQNSGGGGITFS